MYTVNFLNTYPRTDDPKFYLKLFKKKEFQDLLLSDKEKHPEKPGELYNYQKIQKIMFSPNTPYTKGIILASPGVGKTCIISAIVENFKNMIVDGIKRKPALVVVPNTELVSTMMKEISSKCTIDLYKASVTEKHVKRGITELTERMEYISFKKAFSSSYQIVTLEKFFTGNAHKNYDFFSNRIVCIDEAHMIRQYAKKEEGLYESVWKFLHKIKGCRILLFTGTFIWDMDNEAATTLNLLLPKNSQIPVKNFRKIFFDKNKKLTEEGKNYLTQPEILVSVLRAMEDAPLQERGTDSFLNIMTVYPDIFSDFQSKVIIEQEQKIKKQDSMRSYKLAYFNTFVFPKLKDGKIVGYYKDPIDGYVAHVDTKNYTLKKDLFDYIKKNGVYELSTKFASVLDLIKKSPYEKAIIYEEFIKGAGTTLLAAILIANGYEIINTDEKVQSMFSSKKKRFMLIAGQNSFTHNGKEYQSGKIINSVSKAAERYSDPRNATGEYCSIVLGSKKIILGYSFKETRQVHIIEPHWNDSLMEQALRRGYRAGSFEALPPDERYYNVYRHCTVHPNRKGIKQKIYEPQKNTFPPKKEFGDYETRDIIIYKVVEEKAIYRHQIMAFLKTIAFDCGIVYKRNVLKTDIDYSKQCDYGPCSYKCAGIPPGPVTIDYTSYNAYHSKPAIDEYIEETKKRLRDKKIITKKDDPDNEFLTKYAIYTILAKKDVVRDQYWRKKIIGYSGRELFLSEDSKYDPFYVKHSFFSKKNRLFSVVSNILITRDAKNKERMCQVIRGELDPSELSYPTKMMMLEYFFDKKTEELNNHFKNFVHKMSDGSIIHTGYSDQIQLTSYTIVQKVYRGNELFRVWDNKKKQWYFLRDRELEKKYEEELNEKEKERTTIDFGGRIPGDGKFRILSEYTRKGRVCTTIPIELITKIFIDLDCDYPASDSFLKKEKDHLIGMIKSKLDQKYNVVKKDVENLTSKKLASLVTFLSLGSIAHKLCPTIEKIMQKRGLLIYE